MVTGVAQAWARSGYQAPLEQRWDEAVARMKKVNPGYLEGGPRTEANLDILETEIARLTRPPPPDDPAIKAATEELSNLQRRYHNNWLLVKELQQKLRRSANSEVHQLLEDVPADAFEDAGEAIEMGGLYSKYRTAREARAAVAEMLPRTLDMEARQVRLVAALNTAAEPDEKLNRKLLLKMFGRIQEIERQIGRLSQAPAVQNGAVRKRARELSSSGHSTREIAAIVGVSKSTVANYLAEKER